MTRPLDYPIPAWRVTLDGRDLTERIAPRLLELTLTESREAEADQLDLVIHDHDGAMALPGRGVVIALALGWRDTGLVEKGQYTVDEVEYAGAPDVITIRARSADMTSQLRNRRERSWHDTTLGSILRGVAAEHGLTARIDATLASVAVPHLDQVNQSDAALLAQLGEQHDAVATIKAGCLIFAPIGSGTTPGGTPLPGATVDRAEGDQYRYSVAERDAYSGVRAYWHDTGMARRKSVLVGTDDNVRQLRETYDSERTARQHAQAEWGRLQRGTATLGITLALGRADLYPEQTAQVRGFKAELNGAWLVAKVTHTINPSSGFTTALELETSIDG